MLRTTSSAWIRPDIAPAREIDLRDVAGDDRLRAEPEARQEHLHLLAGRVLRLVEDDERVVQRPAAHEAQSARPRWCRARSGRVAFSVSIMS
jgi:hypothetical protein